MSPNQIKNDILAVLQTEKYFSETEFYRLLDDNSIPHKDRIERMRVELDKINGLIQESKIIDALLPDAPPVSQQPVSQPKE